MAQSVANLHEKFSPSVDSRPRRALLDDVSKCDTATAGEIAQGPGIAELSDFTEGQAGQHTFPATGLKITNADPVERDALANALSLANSLFLARLCRDLTWFFIQTDSPETDFSGAYAFWESGVSKPIRFISIPKSVLSNPPDYSSYETNLVNRVIAISAGTIAPPNGIDSVQTSFDPPPGVQANSTDKNIALLAIISHELGHILAERLLLPINGRHNICKNGGKTFTEFGWLSIGTTQSYHRFGEDVFGTHQDSTEPFPASFANGNSATANNQFKTLYKGKHNFPSLLAALAPDDDIAESFRYWALSNNTASGSPSRYWVQITLTNGLKLNVTDNLKLGNNKKKQDCIEQYVKIDDP